MDWRFTHALPEDGSVPMQQHPAYGRACAGLGARVLGVEARRDGARVATALVLVRRWPLFGDFALLARGPIWLADVPEAVARAGVAELARLLRQRFRGVAFTTDGDGGGRDFLDDAGLLPMVTAGTQARLSLEGGQAARLARQHGKWRNRMRRARASGLTVVQQAMPADADHWLLRREMDQARRRGYKRLPPEFTRAWILANGRDSARLCVALAGGEPVAAMLFLLHGASASYHVGWSGPQGRMLSAHNLLLWEGAEWMAAQGCRWIDLGVLDTERAPGLARFKLGAGAKPMTLGATWLDAPGARLLARALPGAGAKGRRLQRNRFVCTKAHHITR